MAGRVTSAKLSALLVEIGRYKDSIHALHSDFCAAVPSNNMDDERLTTVRRCLEQAIRDTEALVVDRNLSVSAQSMSIVNDQGKGALFESIHEAVGQVLSIGGPLLNECLDLGYEATHPNEQIDNNGYVKATNLLEGEALIASQRTLSSAQTAVYRLPMHLRCRAGCMEDCCGPPKPCHVQ